jgi:NDP-sugar pyrophosphorylase family protein
VDALVLAAGLGTRLRPLTDATPKALLEVGGRTLLEHVVERLLEAGVDRLVVNVHHHAEAIERFLAERGGFGVECVVSREVERPLETGGGLLAAAARFRKKAPFFVHNVDVLSDLPLGAMYAFHRREQPLATVAVMARETTRHLLFDERGLLGRDDRSKDLDLRTRESEGPVRALGFAGVHVVSPAIFDRIEERGAFSILEPYLRLAGEGERILPFRVDGHAWLDVGRVEHLEEARRRARGGSRP